MHGSAISELLRALKYAIDQALWDSVDVRAAIAALEHAGRDVQIAIDATIVDTPAAPIVTQGQLDSGGLLMLNATDVLFLRALKISVEAGVEP